ncbi:Cupredoxin [Microdochium bolleyi]|uniref:Cupredoxin n=1 Tax=Microdochium bolleyi TaxID=196109 RepID=A0A136JJC3_9PEZI|nr:Cupredoxin [Microdochium bolleyi]
MTVGEKRIEHDPPIRWRGLKIKAAGKTFLSAVIVVATSLGILLANHPTSRAYLGRWFETHWLNNELLTPEPKVIRRYDLQVGTRWMNPDGGRWRPMYVCNGESPCPTLYAEEGDVVEIEVHSDSYFQSSIHWAGVGYKHTGAWHDGTAGNHTIVHDTTGAWGLSWYADHTTAASVDGLYGMVYVAPSRDRLRPYGHLTTDPAKLKQIMSAEHAIRHLAIKNHQHRDTNWKLLRMRAEGSEYHCYNSIIVNGKGRNLCRPKGYEQLNGHDLDETGCIQPPGLPAESCTPSEADFEIIETQGQRYIMMNLVNIGFEHELQVSIDKHKLAVVANDGGFVMPEVADTVYIPCGARVTILVELDQTPADYTMRMVSVSQLQNLQGFAILRYPAKRLPVYGQPMQLPRVSPEASCIHPDGVVAENCTTIDAQRSAPFPSQPPPSGSDNPDGSHHPPTAAAAKTDFTFRLSAASQSSKTDKYAPEYLLNSKPWPLSRGSLKPLLFANLSSPDEHERALLDKPVIHGIPLGAVVDLIIENTLNESIPLYKHGDPAWLLGARADERFGHGSVEEAFDVAAAASAKSVVSKHLNLKDPALVVVHDLPPLGWSVLRFKVSAQAATMIHATKLRYFLLGMSAPILEGVTVDNSISVPDSATRRPHVEFDPKNDGVFG